MPFTPYAFTSPDDPAREDDGLFGRGSVTWRIMNSRIMWVAALRALYGKDVHLNVDLDPSVLGGLAVRIGDEIIDGTVATRLAEAARELAG